MILRKVRKMKAKCLKKIGPVLVVCNFTEFLLTNNILNYFTILFFVKTIFFREITLRKVRARKVPEKKGATYNADLKLEPVMDRILARLIILPFFSVQDSNIST